MPLPRPTTLHRSLDLDDPMTREGVATYADMRGVNAGNRAAARAVASGHVPGEPLPPQAMSLEDALALTKIVEEDGLLYRHWPAGVVPAGGRPELDAWAKMVAPNSTLFAYRAGEECKVPLPIGEREGVPAES